VHAVLKAPCKNDAGFYRKSSSVFRVRSSARSAHRCVSDWRTWVRRASARRCLDFSAVSSAMPVKKKNFHRPRRRPRKAFIYSDFGTFPEEDRISSCSDSEEKQVRIVLEIVAVLYSRIQEKYLASVMEIMEIYLIYLNANYSYDSSITVLQIEIFATRFSRYKIYAAIKSMISLAQFNELSILFHHKITDEIVLRKRRLR